MNKSELITILSETTDISKVTAGAVVNAITDTITEKLQQGESIALPGFGTFIVTSRSARAGRNPQTGESITIAAATLPKFKPGKAFKDAVNG